MDAQARASGTFGDRARAATDAAEARTVYDAWAPTYDADLGGPSGDDYPLPATVAELVAGRSGPETDVLDAACGTGLVGAALAARGFTSVDGLDVSPRMLAVARTRRAYHDLGPADLRRRLPGAGDKFGVVVCVNALGPGHLPFSALAEFARVVWRGGHIVLTVDPADRPSLDPVLDRLESGAIARVVATSEEALHPSSGRHHHVVVLEVVAMGAPMVVLGDNVRYAGGSWEVPAR